MMKLVINRLIRLCLLSMLYLLMNCNILEGQTAFDFASLPNTKNSYRIKAPARVKSLLAYQQFMKKNPEPRLINNNDSLYLSLSDGILPAVKFFRRRRDGFALEVVSFDQYNCNNGLYGTFQCRRNGTGIFAGDVHNPLFKKYIFRHLISTDSKLKPIDFLINIGSVPQNPAEIPFQLNLLVLKRRRVVDVWHFSNLCADPVMAYQPTLPLFDLEETIKKVNYQPRLKYDTLRMFIPFERNDVSIPSNYMDHLRYFVSRADREIIRAQITAYASVEGTPDINRKLYLQRAEPLLKIIKEFADTSTMVIENIRENWDLFFRQIKNTPDTFLLDLDTVQIRKYVNDTIYGRRFNAILDQQRYTLIIVIGKPRVNNTNIDSFAVAEYETLTETSLKNYYSGKWNEFPSKVKAHLANIQLFLINRFLSGNIPYQTIEHLTLNKELMVRNSKEKLFEPMVFNKLFFEYLHFKDEMDFRTIFQYLDQLRKYKDISPSVIYNYYAILINQGTDLFDHMIDLKVDISQMENAGLDTIWLDKLRLFYHHQNAIRYFQPLSSKVRGKARTSNLFLFKYYSKEIDDKKRILISRHLVAFDMYKQALEMLKPLVTRKVPDVEAIKLRLLILYSSYHGKKPDDFYKELMDAAEILPSREWCNLFTNACGLNFQLLDYQPLWILYCKKQSELMPDLLQVLN